MKKKIMTRSATIGLIVAAALISVMFFASGSAYAQVVAPGAVVSQAVIPGASGVIIAPRSIIAPRPFVNPFLLRTFCSPFIGFNPFCRLNPFLFGNPFLFDEEIGLGLGIGTGVPVAD
jgi:hypothetical protein